MNTEENIFIDDKIMERFEKIDIFNALERLQLEVPHLGEYAMYSIPDDLKVKEKEVYTKHDIMLIFDCADKKALAILKLMKQCDYAVQIGKEFYTTKEKLKNFLDEQMGNSLAL